MPVTPTSSGNPWTAPSPWGSRRTAALALRPANPPLAAMSSYGDRCARSVRAQDIAFGGSGVPEPCSGRCDCVRVQCRLRLRRPARAAAEDVQEPGEDISRYAGWVAELAALLPARARVVDLGCGAGILATRELPVTGCRSSGLISPPSSSAGRGGSSRQHGWFRSGTASSQKETRPHPHPGACHLKSRPAERIAGRQRGGKPERAGGKIALLARQRGCLPRPSELSGSRRGRLEQPNPVAARSA